MLKRAASLRHNAPELHEKVRSGAMTLTAAYKAHCAAKNGASIEKPDSVYGLITKAGINVGSRRQVDKARAQIRETLGVSHMREVDLSDPAQRAAVTTAAAKAAGKSADEQYADHRREVAALPESSKAKFERLAAKEKQLLETIFHDEVRAEALKMVPELRVEMERARDEYIHENSALARIKAGVTPLISEHDYRFLLGVLHPDRAPADCRDKFARAFDIVRKLDRYIEACKT